MLALAVSFEGFEPIARGNPEIDQYSCLIQQAQFSQRDILNVGR
jgi:hypothetical protein